jgi:FAD binding domain
MAEFNAPNASPVPVWLEERSVMPAHNARASMPSTECLRYGATKSQSTKHRQVSASRCAHNLDNDEPRSIACHYLVGCDGGRSMVRKAIGAKFSGTTEIERVQSTCIRSPGLMTLLRGKPAWMYLALNPRRCGTVIAVDGRETWLIHNALRKGEAAADSVDRGWAIRTILGVEPDFRYEVVSKEDWVGRRLVAYRFRDRRVFICGDAAHVWMPAGGYGMNAGIADAANLSWLLAAVLAGWASSSILDAYEAERQPVTEQVSRFTMDSGSRITKQRREVPAGIESFGSIGEAIRAHIGKEAYALDVERQCCGGLVRPDQHVAWRGDEEPTSQFELIDLIRGCGAASERAAAHVARHSSFSANSRNASGTDRDNSSATDP